MKFRHEQTQQLLAQARRKRAASWCEVQERPARETEENEVPHPGRQGTAPGDTGVPRPGMPSPAPRETDLGRSPPHIRRSE